jgi:putative redox-active protein with C_GCAxxG_C_C motif/flagellar hook capping protein FlgD
MDSNISRKQFLRQGTKYAASIAVGATAFNILHPGKAGASAQMLEHPMQYVALDAETVRIYGHDEYYNGKGCSGGSFAALKKALSEKIGEPWASFPEEMLLFGNGGGAGWGATCGALVGTAALISLVTDKATASKLVSELYGWYTQVDLPTATSNDLAIANAYDNNKLAEALDQNTSHSPLCHTSVTLWCETAAKEQSDMERKERCARLTGDVAAYGVMLLNDNLQSVFNPLYVTPQAVTDCMTCHKGGSPNNVAAKMECEPCHGDAPHTSGIRQIGEMSMAYTLSANYPNPFNPSTVLRFAVPKGENVKLYIFDSYGRLIAKLMDGEYTAPGEYEVTWNGKSDFGIPITSGAYYARMTAGSYSKTRKMLMVK